jgi:zinc protease
MMANQSSRKFSIRFLILTALILSIIGAAVYFNFVWQSKRTEIHFNEGWYESFNLKNGMQVVVIPNHKIPEVSHMVWYKVGAMDEMRGKSGVAHFLEHLMFKGTKKYRDGAFSKIVALNGGKENAFTGHDYTAYFQTISKDKLPLVMELEADRMRNLILSEDDVEKELQVIIEERRMRTDNEPRALLREQLYAALFQNHPYGNPVIGWMHEMENLTREDAIKHYRTYYAPNDAILVVAGDVTVEEVKKLAQKYYGKLKKSDMPKRPELLEPPQRAARSLVMEDERVKEPEWWRVYYAPSYNQDKTEMYYPLTVLSKILGEGNLSRLYQKMVVEKKISTVVGTSYSGLSRGPGDFTFYALPAKGVELSEIEKAINAEIEDIAKNGVNPVTESTVVRYACVDIGRNSASSFVDH